MHAIILAGGLGERLRPLTDNTPKPLLPVHGKPTIQWAIENLKKNGITNIILSIGFKADKIKEHFGDGSQLGVNLQYNVEEELLGTGGATKDIVKKFGINNDFLLVWGDNLGNYNFKELLSKHKENNANVTMALTPREDVENFGVATLEENKIINFIEKPPRDQAPSNLINAGAFAINPKMLEILPEGKSSIEREFFERLSPESGFYAHKHEGYWLPTDTLEKYNNANAEMSKQEE